MPARLAIGVDAGGTKVKGLLVDTAEGTILDRRTVDTPAEDSAASLRAIVSVGLELMRRAEHVLAIGVGAAGMVDRHGFMRFAPNVAWRDVPIRDEVAAATGLPTVVDNDANAAAWGEFRYGAAQEFNDMLLVTVGTGIGGGIVSDGRLVRGAHGFAGEIGHIIVEPNGPRCGCGNLGCWEQVASGRALDRLGREAAQRQPASTLARMAGGDAEKVSGRLVSEAAKYGDPVAIRVLADVGRRLGEGIAGLVNVLDPEVVVVGGGVADVGDALLDPARRAFEETVEAPQHRPRVPIIRAKLGNDAGGVGAADLAVLELDEPRAQRRGEAVTG
ncbi:MAG TPA: ROK family glucokinase [Actinomycetota bacterium]|nr:ROK family glucokinase [Actinomycetota bacterium]